MSVTEVFYCDPTDFVGYHGCGKVSKVLEWKERKIFNCGNPRLCPKCGKASTNLLIDKFNLWKIKDKE